MANRFSVNYRLQGTTSKTHPIQILLNLSVKDPATEKYLVVVAQTGITVKKTEWNVGKKLPNEVLLQKKLTDLKVYLMNQMEGYEKYSNQGLVVNYKAGAFKELVQSAVKRIIHESPSHEELLLHEVSMGAMTNLGAAYDYIKDRMIKNGYRMYDAKGKEIDLDKFFAPGLYRDIKKSNPKELLTINSNEELIGSTESANLFYEYIKEVGQRKVRKKELEDPHPYELLSKMFEKYDSKLMVFEVSDKRMEGFIDYIYKNCKSIGDIGKKIDKLKAVLQVLKKDEEYEHHKLRIDPQDKQYRDRSEKIPLPYLTEQQLKAMMQVKFNKEQELHEYIRNIFIVASYTGGIRFGDYKQLFHINQQKVEKDGTMHDVYFIQIMSEKVPNPTKIPLLDFVYDIIAKYDFKFREVDNQVFNRYLKDVCKWAGKIDKSFNQQYVFYKQNPQTGKPEIFKRKFKGEAEPRIPYLYDMIASHTARRSFCTNFHHHRKLSAPVVMEFSNHTDLKTFNNYIKVSSLENFEEFAREVVIKDRLKIKDKL